MEHTLLADTIYDLAIVGGGPAGLLLSHILDRNGIDSIVLERQTRTYVLERIRAGVLEAGTVALLREVGLGERMDREGLPHDGSSIVWEDRPHFLIDTKKYTGKPMMAYGQTNITEDLYAARDAAGVAGCPPELGQISAQVRWHTRSFRRLDEGRPGGRCGRASGWTSRRLPHRLPGRRAGGR